MTESLFQYDCKCLIAEVEKRRALYDPTDEDYPDKKCKKRLWKEICEVIIPEWDDLEKEDKDNKIAEVRRKWKNIRDYYRKDINHRIKFQQGEAKPKQRKHIYYNQLKFLLPCFQNAEEIKLDETIKNDEPMSPAVSAHYSFNDETKENFNEYLNLDPTINTISGKSQSQYTNIQQSVNNVQNEIDEDQYFLLSLLPTVRTLNSEQKLLLKIEILQSIKNIAYPSLSIHSHNYAHTAGMNNMNECEDEE